MSTHRCRSHLTHSSSYAETKTSLPLPLSHSTPDDPSLLVWRGLKIALTFVTIALFCQRCILKGSDMSVMYLLFTGRHTVTLKQALTLVHLTWWLRFVHSYSKVIRVESGQVSLILLFSLQLSWAHFNFILPQLLVLLLWRVRRSYIHLVTLWSWTKSAWVSVCVKACSSSPTCHSSIAPWEGSLSGLDRKADGGRWRATTTEVNNATELLLHVNLCVRACGGVCVCACACICQWKWNGVICVCFNEVRMDEEGWLAS